MKRVFRYIYGPVSSWRLGISLGVDLLSSEEKICNFNCIYCQLGKTIAFTRKRKIFVPTDKLIEELKSLPPALKIDYITFSGRGEPTLAKNLGQAIEVTKGLRKEPVAVLTNASLMDTEGVCQELALADFVIAKLDAYSQASFGRINKPALGLKFSHILKALNGFRKKYRGKLGLQIMFTRENKDKAPALSDMCKNIHPDEIQLNTPLRPCSVIPLSQNQMLKIKRQFKEVNAISVYEVPRQGVIPLSLGNTQVRRGKGTKYA